MYKINDIPVFNAVLDEYMDGMTAISLVDMPAVETDFVAFSKKKAPVMFSIEAEEKRLVFGVVMRADFPIIRETPDGTPFYIVYSADTIRKMAEKYLLEGRQNLVDLQHEFWTDGVHMVQWFIKDSSRGIVPAGFEDIADGSLFAEFHIENDDVWKGVKDGTFRGFSLEGYFSFTPAAEPTQMSKLTNILKSDMTSNIKRLKNKLAKLIAEFEAISTDKGVIVIDREGEDIEIGDTVFLIPEGATEDEKTVAPDGEYTLPDGAVVVVADGKVNEYRAATINPAPEAEPEGDGDGEVEGKKCKKKMEEAPEVVIVPEEIPEEKDKAREAFEELASRVDVLEASVADIVARLEALEAKPAAEPAAEEFRRKEVKVETPTDRRSLRSVSLSDMKYR